MASSRRCVVEKGEQPSAGSAELCPGAMSGGCHLGGGKAWRHRLQTPLGGWGDHGVQSSTFTFITDLEDLRKGFLGFLGDT